MKIEEAKKKKSASEAEKLRVELKLEKEKHQYEMRIKTLELELERKRTDLAKKESEKWKWDATISELKAQKCVEKEREEKEDLKVTQSKQIEELKWSNAQLKQQLKSYEEKPVRFEIKPTDDYM